MNRITDVMRELGLLPEAAMSMLVEPDTVTVRYGIAGLMKALEKQAQDGEPGRTPFDETAPNAPHPLETIFDQCVEQAVSGKGEERHGHGTPFMEQPWHQIADRQGLGFLMGQAEKKIGEATTFLQQNPGADGVAFWQKEIRGAINYLAMAMLFVEEEIADLTADVTGCGDCDGCSCADQKPGRAPMDFCPQTGATPFPGPYDPDEYRAYHGSVAWLFNPWTGAQRNPHDIGTDPLGHLIAPF